LVFFSGVPWLFPLRGGGVLRSISYNALVAVFVTFAFFLVSWLGKKSPDELEEYLGDYFDDFDRVDFYKPLKFSFSTALYVSNFFFRLYLKTAVFSAIVFLGFFMFSGHQSIFQLLFESMAVALGLTICLISIRCLWQD